MKYFFGILAFIAAIVVVILLATSLFRGFGTAPASSYTQTVTLTDENIIDSVARYVMTGPVVAKENYQEVRITISKNARTLEVVNGYQGDVVQTQTLQNTEDAYRAFLGALSAANFSYKRDTGEIDPRVTCVTGQKYYYVLQVESEKKVDTWSTSCASSQGNYGGLAEPTFQLFQAQIPNYAELTRGVSLAAY